MIPAPRGCLLGARGNRTLHVSGLADWAARRSRDHPVLDVEALSLSLSRSPNSTRLLASLTRAQTPRSNWAALSGTPYLPHGVQQLR